MKKIPHLEEWQQIQFFVFSDLDSSELYIRFNDDINVSHTIVPSGVMYGVGFNKCRLLKTPP